MDCMVDEAARQVTFLYKFTRGVATDSYGLHCAQAAGLPAAVVERAAQRKQDLESSGGGLKVVLPRCCSHQRHEFRLPLCVFPCCLKKTCALTLSVACTGYEEARLVQERGAFI
jgi:hypothetical protein